MKTRAVLNENLFSQPGKNVLTPIFIADFAGVLIKHSKNGI
jgi:hypothetical protein